MAKLIYRIWRLATLLWVTGRDEEHWVKLVLMPQIDNFFSDFGLQEAISCYYLWCHEGEEEN